MTATLAQVTTRPVRADDDALLRSLYASTRRHEFGTLGWPEASIVAFCNQQFDAQQQHYAVTHPHAARSVIVAGGDDIGQLVVDRSGRDHVLVDFSLSPAARGRGIGTTILRELTDAADRCGAAITLSVLHHNPARRLYARFGFKPTDSDEIRTTMRRTPARSVPIRKDTT